MKLLNGDCIEIMKEMPSESVDLIVTDPPYEIQKYGKCIHGGFISGTEVGRTGIVFNHNPDISEWLSDLFRLLKQDGHAYIMTNVYNLHRFLNEIDKVGFKLTAMLIWDKVQKIITPYLYLQLWTVFIIKKHLNQTKYTQIIRAIKL